MADRDGVVTDIHAEPGQVVSAGDVVAKIADLKQLEVNVGLAESAMKGLMVGSPVVVRLWVNREKAYQGKIREIAPGADSVTRTFLVKVSILDIDEAVKLGMTAGVGFANTEESIAVLPSSAITELAGKTAVWIVDAHTKQVHPRNVTIGSYREDGVPVNGGLNTGEQVVVAGVHMLVDGQTVRPVEAGVAK
jgi:RND family efflux transporter MFP subunit